MTYREMLELYSQGRLDEQQRTEIERELEKQQAFTDYLFEHQIQIGAEGVQGGNPAFASNASDGEGKTVNVTHLLSCFSVNAETVSTTVRIRGADQ